MSELATDEHPTLASRFNQIGWTETDGGCWEWNGSRHVRGGYGQISGSRKSGPLKAHRVAYELQNGEIPEGHLIRHSCDNPPCVNPSHLSSGTSRDNSQDAVSRGRATHQVRSGQFSPSRRLTWEQVGEIRKSVESGVVLGAMYGVSTTSISNIRLFKTWKGQGSVETRSI